MELKQLKPKKCKNCKSEFKPVRSLQSVCGIECAKLMAEKKRINSAKVVKKAQNRELKAAKERIKSRGDYAKDAQIAFNAYIRARDDGKPCISCGSHTGKKNAGHYRSVGSCPELRFEESQVHLQCEKCNSYLSGNLINYRIELIKRIGLDKVEYLEGPHEPKKYTIQDLKDIKSLYKQKLKELAK